MSARYVFHTEWHLAAASPDDVYAALHDVASYPQWWPQVRSVRALDEVTGELRCRSMLPYDLVFVVSREIEDPSARVLAARQTGDLEGTSRWTINEDGDGTTAVFDEDVVVRKALVRAAGVIARPALRFNHDRMMHDGERGLRRYLEQRP
jgi:hypothetical protein